MWLTYFGNIFTTALHIDATDVKCIKLLTYGCFKDVTFSLIIVIKFLISVFLSPKSSFISKSSSGNIYIAFFVSQSPKTKYN